MLIWVIYASLVSNLVPMTGYINKRCLFHIFGNKRVVTDIFRNINIIISVLTLEKTTRRWCYRFVITALQSHVDINRTHRSSQCIITMAMMWQKFQTTDKRGLYVVHFTHRQVNVGITIKFILIAVQLSNHKPGKMSDEITYPFRNVNDFVCITF